MLAIHLLLNSGIMGQSWGQLLIHSGFSIEYQIMFHQLVAL